MQLAIREVLERVHLGYQALGLAAAVAVLAWLGPFDTWGSLSLPDRVGFWTLATSVNWLFGLVLGSAAGLVFDRRGVLAWAAAVIGGSAVAAVPGTTVVWLLVAAYMDHRMTEVAEIASLYSQVIVIHLVLNALVTWLIWGKSRPGGAEGEAVSPHPIGESPSAPFLERLPSRLGRNLLHLHMQDHYVEAHTDEGSELLLLRFRDTLRELDGLDGAQVHLLALGGEKRRRRGREAQRAARAPPRERERGPRQPLLRSPAPGSRLALAAAPECLRFVFAVNPRSSRCTPGNGHLRHPARNTLGCLPEHP